ncbi:DUF721 domain-containing protein [Candidatus Finniella inopinata]|nr:DUF721 domain-containing protein [Candidatus Finniella inopinata]
MPTIKGSAIAKQYPRFSRAGRSLGVVMGKVMTPVCRQQGLITADLVLEWPRVVGAELANVSQVLKISFSAGRRQQGCLHLQTSSTMAAVLTYSQATIIERVNQYYGYQAIDRVRVFHKPLSGVVPIKKTATLVKAPLPEAWQGLLQDVSDDSLKQALENLATSLQARVS